MQDNEMLNLINSIITINSNLHPFHNVERREINTQTGSFVHMFFMNNENEIIC